jgi:polyhydroxyalkanoate synthesis regulator phasin
MIAYELGMAADTLAEEAKPIEDQLQVDGNGGTAQLATVAAEQRRNLIKKLREGGDLLKETARAIVIDLQ